MRFAQFLDATLGLEGVSVTKTVLFGPKGGIFQNCYLLSGK